MHRTEIISRGCTLELGMGIELIYGSSAGYRLTGSKETGISILAFDV